MSKAPESLSVWWDTSLVGTITQTTSGLDFSYDAIWLSRQDARAISNSLPLRDPKLSPDAATAFFENLLPEGDVRERVASIVGTDPGNAFRILAEIGGDCAGALQLLLAGNTARPAVGNQQLPRVSEDELEQVLANLGSRPLLAGANGLRRLSLAGAQRKLALIVHDDGSYSWPTSEAASTHIIKVPIADLAGSVANECFMLELTQLLGLTAAPVRMLQVGDLNVLCVERYDRRDDDGIVRRLHQEDMCQALGILSRNKYERDGGPGVTACVQVLRAATRVPAKEVLAFAQLVVFNTLAGNADAHGKNYSLLFTDTSCVLAPAYDVLCTEAWRGQLDSNLAMGIGAKHAPWHLYESDWRELARDTLMGPGPLLQLVGRWAHEIPVRAEELAATWRDRGDHEPIIDDIVATISGICRSARSNL